MTHRPREPACAAWHNILVAGAVVRIRANLVEMHHRGKVNDRTCVITGAGQGSATVRIEMPAVRINRTTGPERRDIATLVEFEECAISADRIRGASTPRHADIEAIAGMQCAFQVS